MKSLSFPRTVTRFVVLFFLLAAAFLECSPAREVGAADPFTTKPWPLPTSPNSPRVTTPSSESPTEAIGVAARLLAEWETAPMQGSGSSPPQPIVLEPRQGTGFGSLTGLLGAGKADLNHQLDPKTSAQLAQLIDAISKLKEVKVEVPITPKLPPETSQSLSQLSSQFTWLWWLASVVISIFGIDKAGRWVAPAVNGLRSFAAARSRGQLQLSEVAASIEALKSSVEGIQAVRSSTPKRGSSSA